MLAGAAMLACEMASPATPTPTGGDAAGLDAATPVFGAELGFCADEINRYRTSIGRAPLRRTDALESFAATAAERDGTAHVAHTYFKTTNGAGIALAETEILWWRGFAVKAVIQKGLAQMWQQGPSGEHFQILAGSYSEVGCGIFVNGPEVTVTQDLR